MNLPAHFFCQLIIDRSLAGIYINAYLFEQE